MGVIPPAPPAVNEIPPAPPAVNEIPPAPPAVYEIPPAPPAVNEIPPAPPAVNEIPPAPPAVDEIPPAPPAVFKEFDEVEDLYDLLEKEPYSTFQYLDTLTTPASRFGLKSYLSIEGIYIVNFSVLYF